MNSIPKTTRQSYVWCDDSNICYIDQSRHGDEIINYSTTNNSTAGDYTIAIFRVYPKGQNPMSKTRQNKKDFESLKPEIEKYHSAIRPCIN